MERRQYLGIVLSGVIIGIPGCLSNAESEESDQSVHIIVENHERESLDGEITIFSQDKEVYSRDLSFSGDKSTVSNLRISESGVYQVQMDVNESEYTTRFPIEDYHIKNQRAVTIHVRSDEMLAVVQD